MVDEKEFEDFLEHVGVKGMKWGVRKSSSDSSGSQPRKKMSSDQKRVLKTAAVGVGVAALAVGALYASRKINMNVPLLKATKGSTTPRAAASVKRGTQAVKKIKMDKELSDFLSDSARRIASDQKGWSDSFGIGLDRIAREDQAWMVNYIKNMGTRAISA